MTRNLNLGITRQPYSDFAELKRRRDEQLDKPPELGPLLSAKSHLRELSLHGFTGEAVRKPALHTGPHPASIRFHKSLGNAVGSGPLRATTNHVRLIARIIERELTGNLHSKAHKPLRVAAHSRNFLT